jgi:hypothetical protein
MRSALSLLLLLFPATLQAQFTYVLDQEISVANEDGDAIDLAWTGGLNAAHYNTMDLNGDGNDDLVLYDRMGDKIFTFLSQNDKYTYAPEFEEFFPDDVTNWLLLTDYNCDGKKDIFTGNILGVKVYTNVTAPGENLTWEHFTFFSGVAGSRSDVLLTKGFTNKINLQLQFDDLPSITDADGDGDLDIFNVHFVGEGTIEYHKNFTMERYGTCDSLDFERVTQQWGGVTECDCGEFAFNSQDCAPSGGRTKHAGGKSLLMMDVDNNGTLDALIAEGECNNLYALLNEGTVDSPIIDSFTPYPETSPASFVIYPAPFYEDVDFDGRRDLIVVPNIFSKPLDIFNANLNNSNWLYKNTGTDAAPNFTFTTSSFLQDQMIDVGDNAIPAFADYEGDGDLDMFISNNGLPGQGTTVWLYENVGTASDPAFKLADKDIFGFSESSFFNLKIQFADLNNDLKNDLAFTATSFLNGQTWLFYLANKASAGIDFSGVSISQVDVAITSLENVSCVDVNGDGFQDLLIGKSNGNLQYWKNAGQATPQFSLEDDSFLGLPPSIFSQNIATAEGDLDGNGTMDLILGDQRGVVTIVSNFREVSAPGSEIANIIFNPLSQDYTARNLGGRIWPVAANIFNTDKLAIIVGNALGGVSVLRNDDGRSLPKDPVVIIYPNPVDKEAEAVNVQVDRPATLQLYNALGQEIITPVQIPGSETFRFKMPYVPDGVYFLRITSQGRSVGQRLVVH